MRSQVGRDGNHRRPWFMLLTSNRDFIFLNISLTYSAVFCSWIWKKNHMKKILRVLISVTFFCLPPFCNLHWAVKRHFLSSSVLDGSQFVHLQLLYLHYLNVDTTPLIRLLFSTATIASKTEHCYAFDDHNLIWFVIVVIEWSLSAFYWVFFVSFDYVYTWSMANQSVIFQLERMEW